MLIKKILNKLMLKRLRKIIFKVSFINVSFHPSFFKGMTYYYTKKMTKNGDMPCINNFGNLLISNITYIINNDKHKQI